MKVSFGNDFLRLREFVVEGGVEKTGLQNVNKIGYYCLMETTCAYLAGAVDADGFISIGRKVGYRRKKDGRTVTYYVVKIGLSETSPIIPDLLQSMFPAWRGEHQPKNPLHKRWHIWQATNHKAKEPLERLLPYLRLKGQQAQLALDLIDLMARQNSGRFMAKPLTVDEEAARAALYEAVTTLNDPRNRRVHFPRKAA
jgi:hypothetical protein